MGSRLRSAEGALRIAGRARIAARRATARWKSVGGATVVADMRVPQQGGHQHSFGSYTAVSCANVSLWREPCKRDFRVTFKKPSHLFVSKVGAVIIKKS